MFGVSNGFGVVGAAAAGREPVWFVGDSLAVGMSRAAGNQAVLTGQVGARSRETVNWVAGELVGRGPNDLVLPGRVVVSLGANNNRVAVKDFQRDVETLLELFGSRCVVWLTVHRESNGGSWNRLNAVLLRTVARFGNVRVLDWHEYASWNTGRVSGDGVHPVTGAYRVLERRANDLLDACTARTTG